MPISSPLPDYTSNASEIGLKCKQTPQVDRKDLEEILFEAVDEGLETFGKSTRSIIYHYLEVKYSLPRYEIPFRLDDFCSGIRMILGSSSSIVEQLILKELCNKLGASYEKVENMRLQCAVNNLIAIHS